MNLMYKLKSDNVVITEQYLKINVQYISSLAGKKLKILKTDNDTIQSVQCDLVSVRSNNTKGSLTSRLPPFPV